MTCACDKPVCEHCWADRPEPEPPPPIYVAKCYDCHCDLTRAGVFFRGSRVYCISCVPDVEDNV